MRSILVRRRHGLGLAEARRLAETTAKRLREEHGGTFQWDGDTLRFKRTGASGRIVVTNDEVDVRVDLGLLLLPLRARIAREIHAFFDDRLGAAVTAARGQPLLPAPLPTRPAARPSAPSRSSRSQGASRSTRPK